MSEFIGEDSTQQSIKTLDRHSNQNVELAMIDAQLETLRKKRESILPGSKKIQKLGPIKSSHVASGMIANQAGKKIATSRKNISANEKPMKRNAVRILNVSYPAKIQNPNPKFKATWSVNIKYIGDDGKNHQKEVHFGDKDLRDYHETKDEMARLRRVNSQRKTLNVLYPQFWNYLFLNHHSGDLTQAFSDILKSLKLV